ncbi:hypothetical protein SAMN02745165_03508 [Malonomonas rubra DSM 5091]|uniref:Uncharacterized protein n=1 Tax=Malonomonas rubra DSM 5091 TaxID=1122189 RepID=A0A1M6N4L6_MALRU|nr:hypothetical protein [Malonomonas rubra]SHJ90566.1 hypothetical protein SAMN02745165_03508 [Malonomonas rubra DSM 5091]
MKQISLFLPALLLLSSLLPAFSAAAEQDYFYLREKQNSAYRNSCAQVFDDIRNGKEADVGGVIRLLKNLNVDYRLRDYDNAITPRTRQVYVGYDDLIKEVAANKQEIYCKIELAQYMRGKSEFSGPIYDLLLDAAFEKLEETYTKANTSLSSGDFERAIYAFDLIAPYADSYRLFLLAGDKQLEESGALAQQVVEHADDDKVVKRSAGVIAQALIASAESISANAGSSKPKEPGPIALAARIGAITAALHSEE